MGTDIHCVFQKYNNTWEDISSNYDENRHYLLFAWLGNVRNGHGFAGVPTHKPIIPLSDRRGLPEDFEVDDDNIHKLKSIDLHSPHHKDFLIKYQDENVNKLKKWMGDHSHSWLLGYEILSAKSQKVYRVGIITIDEYKKWDGESTPDFYCGDKIGPNVVINYIEDIDENTTDVAVYWEEDLLDELKYFIDEVRRLAEKYVEIRVVFGFDS